MLFYSNILCKSLALDGYLLFFLKRYIITINNNKSLQNAVNEQLTALLLFVYRRLLIFSKYLFMLKHKIKRHYSDRRAVPFYFKPATRAYW